ncbi:MAG: hypothetical protein HYR85_27035, partial [Planctomycetes bacterium]|nr:hypothetical protein [Planctomycetota bacterium]
MNDVSPGKISIVRCRGGAPGLSTVSMYGPGRMSSATAKPGDQNLLGGPVESLLEHVDDQHGRRFRFELGEQGDQGVRRGAAFLDEPGEGAIDPQFERWVGGESGANHLAAIRH